MGRRGLIGLAGLTVLAVVTAGCGGTAGTGATVGQAAGAGTASTSGSVGSTADSASSSPAMSTSTTPPDTPSSTMSSTPGSGTASGPTVPSITLAEPPTALAKGLTVSTVIGAGKPVNMEVDTGSNGVLVSKEFVGSDVTPLSPARTFTGFNYSSSGNTYSGQWMKTTLQLGAPDAQEHPAQTVPMLIRVVDEGGVAMMGVGFDRGAGETDQDLDGPALNPFLNLTAMSSGAMPRAYVIGLGGIVLGPTAADLAGFQTVGLTKDAAGTDWDAASACVAVPTGGVPPQCGTLLLDTGLDYAIIQVPDGIEPPTVPAATPGDRPSVATGQQVQITVTGLAEPLYDFTVGGPGAPTSVQWGHLLTDNTIFMNISRYALTQHDYLYDASTGQVGFRPAAAS